MINSKQFCKIKINYSQEHHLIKLKKRECLLCKNKILNLICKGQVSEIQIRIKNINNQNLKN